MGRGDRRTTIGKRRVNSAFKKGRTYDLGYSGNSSQSWSIRERPEQKGSKNDAIRYNCRENVGQGDCMTIWCDIYNSDLCETSVPLDPIITNLNRAYNKLDQALLPDRFMDLY